jgi:hypothetical protein
MSDLLTMEKRFQAVEFPIRTLRRYMLVGNRLYPVFE